MPVERVLVEIMTHYNATGVERAKTGMVGLGASLASATILFAALFEVGKKMVDITEEHTKAESNLAAAIADSGRTIRPTVESVKAYHAALAALADAQKGKYVPATHLTQLQLMKLQDAQARVNATTGQHHINALRRLAELQVQYGQSVHGASTHVGSLAAAQARVAKTAAAMGKEIHLTALNADEVQASLAVFMQTNRDFISNQNDVTTSYAKLIREGVRAKDLSRLMTIALHIQAAEGGSLADAVTLVQQAEVGRNKGLVTAVGLQLEAIKATDTYAQKQAKIERNLQAIAKAYKSATPTALTVAQNHLNTAVEHFAETHGPALVQAETDIVNYTTDHLIPSLETTIARMDDTGAAVDRMVAHPGWNELMRVLFGDGGPIIVKGGPLDRLWQLLNSAGNSPGPSDVIPGQSASAQGAAARRHTGGHGPIHVHPAQPSPIHHVQGTGPMVSLNGPVYIVTPEAHAAKYAAITRASDRSKR